MKDLARIVAAHGVLDAILEDERVGVGGDADAVLQIEARQVLNDQAYFLLCWGQLENEINARCRDAIRRRRANPDWQVRRGWDLYNPDESRLSGLSFDDRFKLVLDMQGGRGTPYARAMAHYEMRNRVAHGKLEYRRLDVAAAADEFYIIQSALHRAI